MYADEKDSFCLFCRQIKLMNFRHNVSVCKIYSKCLLNKIHNQKGKIKTTITTGNIIKQATTHELLNNKQTNCLENISFSKIILNA